MTDIERIKCSVPEEKLLRELIETELFGVAVDECCTEDDMEPVINAVHLYKRATGGRIRVFVPEEHRDTPYIRKLIEGYDLKDDFEFAACSDESRLLACLLGCEALITTAYHSSFSEAEREFCVPRLCLSDKEGFRLENGVLYVVSEPSAIGAALEVVRERKFRKELSDC